MMQVKIGNAPGQVVRLHKPTYLIGRSRVCNLRISDQQLHLVHARLKVDGDYVRLAPQDRAEVMVNGEPISDEVELAAGDFIELGATQLQVADVPAANSSTGSVRPKKVMQKRTDRPSESQASRQGSFKSSARASSPQLNVSEKPSGSQLNSLPEQPPTPPVSAVSSREAVGKSQPPPELAQRVGLDDQDHTLVHATSHQSHGVGAAPVIKDWALSGLSTAILGKHFLVTHSVLIGRASDCDLRVGEAHLSRRHARLTPTAQGLVVEDLESANGTYVNSRRVAKAVLRNGDELSLDTVKFRVEERGVSSSTDETLLQAASHSDAARGEVENNAEAHEGEGSAPEARPLRPQGPTAIEIQRACLQQLGDDQRNSVAAERVARGRVIFAVVLATVAVLAAVGWLAVERWNVAIPGLQMLSAQATDSVNPLFKN